MSTTETTQEAVTGYFPEPGDVVTFPGACTSKATGTERYIILSAQNGKVAYRREHHTRVYINTLDELCSLGITKATP